MNDVYLPNETILNGIKILHLSPPSPYTQIKVGART